MVEEPATQPFSALVRDGGVEQMGQRMGTNEVEICRVGVRAPLVGWSCRDVSPIQRHAGKVCPFNLRPLAEPMNLGLHLVMIGRNGDKDSQEKSQRQVAALVPVELIEGNGTDQAGEEDLLEEADEHREALLHLGTDRGVEAGVFRNAEGLRVHSFVDRDGASEGKVVQTIELSGAGSDPRIVITDNKTASPISVARKMEAIA